jgi:hypothetical protein
VAGAGDGHGNQIAAVATPPVGGEPAAAAPVESAAAAAAKPAEKPPAATSPSGLPDTITVTEEGESDGT